MRRMNDLKAQNHTFKALDEYCYRTSNHLQSSLKKKLFQSAVGQIDMKIGSMVILTRKVGRVSPWTKGILRYVVCSGSYGNIRDARLGIFISEDKQEDTLFEGLENTSSPNLEVPCSVINVHAFNRTVIARRYQIPVIPGYTITIHRSQGMNIKHVAISFRNTTQWRPNGMVYVVLSWFCLTFWSVGMSLVSRSCSIESKCKRVQLQVLKVA